jgi:CBS domain-containing protein
MVIKDILERKGTRVVKIPVHETVHAAIRALNHHGIGALVVMDDAGEIAGIISERDILRECGERCDRSTANPASLESVGPALIRHVMTADVITAGPDESLTVVMSVMTRNRIRHLPVLDEGRLIGIVSIGDVVNAFVQAAESENRLLKEYIQGATW